MKRIAKKTLRFHAALSGIVASFPDGGQADAVDAYDPPATESTPAPATVSPEAEEEQAYLREMLGDLRDLVSELMASRAQNLTELQELSIELGVVIASHIVKSQLDAGEFDLSPVISSALGELGPGSALSVRIHPNDLKSLADLEPNEKLPDLAFEADENLPRGSCVVSNGGGHSLLSTLQDRLDKIRENLLRGIEDAGLERRKAVIDGSSLRRFPDRRKLA